MPPTARQARLRAIRRTHHKRIGPLRDQVIAKKTLTMYKGACIAFFKFARTKPEPTVTPEAVDEALCQFIEAAWEEGDPKALPTNARSGLMHFLPRLRGKLHGAQRLLSAWTKHELPQRAPPLPREFLLALAGRALINHDLRLCVTLLLGFHAMLRTGELLAVRAQHFVHSQHGSTVHLSLPVTKSGQRLQNVPEAVVLDDPLLLAYLRVLLPRLEPGELVYPSSSATFRAAFRQLCLHARLPALTPTWRPYSLRRGGATAHFMQLGSLDRTAVRGRWLSTKTARIYINEAVAALAAIHATPAQQREMRRCAAALLDPRRVP